ncbi:MaoC/PaaZ C-terminal domain-containing protein [Xenorhabdus japonica]|uniref:MaoC like domain-containing protein n=1 Tax=Xenorhabdus japonica TaxID=53341 RepID=A0A1I4YCI9_9GAMM|nr:MaoC/PaaZ C-terminal domain-containing protein [Xenorhabdus japonica]SFN35744.1 MaoC like domain-containing protein [Xenorhabdus japonica]
MIVFTKESINSWLMLSGDTNPIHYDSESANRAGYSAVVVPGMLLAMPIKQTLIMDGKPGNCIEVYFKHIAILGKSYEVIQKENYVNFTDCDCGSTVAFGRKTDRQKNEPKGIIKFGEHILKKEEIYARLQTNEGKYHPIVTLESMFFAQMLNCFKYSNIWGVTGNDWLLSGNLLQANSKLYYKTMAINWINQNLKIDFFMMSFSDYQPGNNNYISVFYDATELGIRSNFLFVIKEW